MGPHLSFSFGTRFRSFLVAVSEGRVFFVKRSFVTASLFLYRFPRCQDGEAAGSGTRSFSYNLLDSHQGLLYPQQHGSFAATRVVLSVLQDARSCAEVAHAVLGMRSLKDGVTL